MGVTTQNGNYRRKTVKIPAKNFMENHKDHNITEQRKRFLYKHEQVEIEFGS